MGRAASIAFAGAVAAVVVAVGVWQLLREPRSLQTPAPAEAAFEHPESAPVLDEYQRLVATLEDRYPMGLAYVLPAEAGLVFVDATPELEAEARAGLIDLQPTIAAVIELSRETPERFRPRAAAGAFDPSPMWLMARPGQIGVVLADASRCFENGDFDAAGHRLAAAIRVGAHELRQPSLSTGSNHALAIAPKKLIAMIESGAVFRDAAREDLRASLGMVGGDPDEFAAEWASGARVAHAAARERYVGRGGGERLAEDIERYGADPEMLDSFRSLLRGPDGAGDTLLLPAIVRKAGARPSARDIQAALDASEQLISRVETALKEEDLVAAFTPIARELEADATQVIRLVIGTPAQAVYQMRQIRAEVRIAMEAIERAR